MARRNFLDATRGYFGGRGVRNNMLQNDPRRRRPGYGVRPMTGGPGGLSPQAQLGWQGQLGAFAPPSMTQGRPPLTPPPGYVQSQRGGPPPPSMQPGASPRQRAFTGPLRWDVREPCSTPTGRCTQATRILRTPWCRRRYDYGRRSHDAGRFTTWSDLPGIPRPRADARPEGLHGGQEVSGRTGTT